MTGEVRALAGTGMLGSGFRLDSLERAIAWRPDFIGCDAGSTDGGPYYLGAGAWQFSRDAVRRDLRLLLAAARRLRVPLLVGSAGTGGADAAVSELAATAVEELRALGERATVAAVYCEQDPYYLNQKLRDGRIRALGSEPPPLDAHVLERSEHVVAMAGVEPFVAALEHGADVVVAGRASDTSIFAAIPLMRGIDPGVAFHAAKILECGAACVTHRLHPDPMFALLASDGFVVEAPNPRFRCTPLSVASHLLYETASPSELPEPSGTLHAEDARYEAVSDRAVRVTRSRFELASAPTVKLEGAELAGHEAFFLGTIRDPVILRQIDRWCGGVEGAVRSRLDELYPEAADRIHLLVRRIGYDAVLGEREPDPRLGSEVGILVQIIAPTERTAREATQTAAHVVLHFPIPEWHGLITTVAFVHSPPECYRGPVYRFTLDHLLELDDPLEPFRIEVVS